VKLTQKQRRVLNWLADVMVESFNDSTVPYHMLYGGHSVGAKSSKTDLTRLPDQGDLQQLIRAQESEARRILLEDEQGWWIWRRRGQEKLHAHEVLILLEKVKKAIAAGNPSMAVLYAFYAGEAVAKMRASLPLLHLIELGRRASVGGKKSARIRHSEQDEKCDRIRLRYAELREQYGKRYLAVGECARELRVSCSTVNRCLRKKKRVKI
jgi:hypothetical protein